MEESNWLRDAERAEFEKLLRQALSSEHVLLYDASGNPIPNESDLWTVGQSEAVRQAHRLLDDLLKEIPPDRIPESPEALVELMKRAASSQPRYTFDVVDGKLSLPFHVTVRGVLIKGHLPLYRLGVGIAGAVAGVLFLRKRKPDGYPRSSPREESRKATPFPRRTTLTLGTHGSSEDLLKALKDADFEIGDFAAEILAKISIARAKTEIEVVTVSGKELGLLNFATLEQIYKRGSKLGLDLVPAEAGPQFRLQRVHWRSDPSNGDTPIPWSTSMAMQPITDVGGEPCVFEVACTHRRRGGIEYLGTLGAKWTRPCYDYRDWLFALP